MQFGLHICKTKGATFGFLSKIFFLKMPEFVFLKKNRCAAPPTAESWDPLTAMSAAWSQAIDSTVSLCLPS